jgi:hypothetical protein
MKDAAGYTVYDDPYFGHTSLSIQRMLEDDRNDSSPRPLSDLPDPSDLPF